MPGRESPPHNPFGVADYAYDVHMYGGRACSWLRDEIDLWKRSKFEGGGESEAEVLCKELWPGLRSRATSYGQGWQVLSEQGLGRR